MSLAISQRNKPPFRYFRNLLEAHASPRRRIEGQSQAVNRAMMSELPHLFLCARWHSQLHTAPSIGGRPDHVDRRPAGKQLSSRYTQLANTWCSHSDTWSTMHHNMAWQALCTTGTVTATSKLSPRRDAILLSPVQKWRRRGGRVYLSGGLITLSLIWEQVWRTTGRGITASGGPLGVPSERCHLYDVAVEFKLDFNWRNRLTS